MIGSKFVRSNHTTQEIIPFQDSSFVQSLQWKAGIQPRSQDLSSSQLTKRDPGNEGESDRQCKLLIFFISRGFRSSL